MHIKSISKQIRFFAMVVVLTASPSYSFAQFGLGEPGLGEPVAHTGGCESLCVDWTNLNAYIDNKKVIYNEDPDSGLYNYDEKLEVKESFKVTAGDKAQKFTYTIRRRVYEDQSYEWGEYSSSTVEVIELEAKASTTINVNETFPSDGGRYKLEITITQPGKTRSVSKTEFGFAPF